MFAYQLTVLRGVKDWRWNWEPRRSLRCDFITNKMNERFTRTPDLTNGIARCKTNPSLWQPADLERREVDDENT